MLRDTQFIQVERMNRLNDQVIMYYVLNDVYR